MRKNKKVWQHEITGVDGNTQLFGVNIFNCDWESTGETAEEKNKVIKRQLRLKNI